MYCPLVFCGGSCGGICTGNGCSELRKIAHQNFRFRYTSSLYCFLFFSFEHNFLSFSNFKDIMNESVWNHQYVDCVRCCTFFRSGCEQIKTPLFLSRPKQYMVAGQKQFCLSSVIFLRVSHRHYGNHVVICKVFAFFF